MNTFNHKTDGSNTNMVLRCSVFFSIILFVGMTMSLNAQNVGINSTGATPVASAMLDIVSSNSGLLIPRVSLSSNTDVVTIPSPATSLLVYNTNASMTNGQVGFFYWNGSQWILFMTGTASAWTTLGNTGTNASTNFIGTTDGVDFVTKTTSVERMRVSAAGMVGINTAPTATEMLTVAGGTINGINATTTSTSTTGYALHAIDTTGLDVYLGYAGGITVAGNPYKKPIVYSNATINGGSGGSPAVLAQSSGTNVASAVVGYSSVSCGGLFYATGNAVGGVWGQNTNATGTGVIGVGNNLGGATFAPGGSGGSFTGDSVGAFGHSSKTHGYGVYGQAAGASSTGVVGVGNNIAVSVLSAGSGGSFSGSTYGIYAATTSAAANPSAAVYTNNATTGHLLYVNYYNGTEYKIISANSAAGVSCSVPDMNGNFVVMHAPETPEFYFQDYGQAKLTNGFVHIELDPILAKNVAINAQHPLRVFIQLEDNENCKGVVIKNKTSHGFDVMEMAGGSSNTPFQYQVTCNVADAVMPSGVISKFQDLRFEPSPKAADVIQSKSESQTARIPK
ncbi:MAG: hypothetical protein WCL14_00995 [Bacteroidota bacterium]